MKKTNYSAERQKYLLGKKKNKIFIISCRILILIAILSLWEILATLNVIDAFITSSPSKIITTAKKLFAENNLTYHMSITLYETFMGFMISAIFGYLIALLLWWSENLRNVLEPYIVVLNSLPKIALGPIIIVWFGAGIKSIIFMTIIIGIIVSIITMLNGFIATDNNKILLLKTMGASKFQILNKLVIPSSVKTFISMLKINVGLSWIGSIMGEYLVSKAGLGYLIVYGGQVFKLDLVMTATVILCFMATVMYLIVAFIEKKISKS
ncbi:MAG: ABC transporter permease [Clostridia bacterium]|nr:ABC transporter permease [Clostridia bacterium]